MVNPDTDVKNLETAVRNLLEYAVQPLWESAINSMDDEKLAEIDLYIAETVKHLEKTGV